MKKTLLTAAALAIISVSCDRQLETPVQYGQLSVALSGEPEVEVLSKVPETLEPNSAAAAEYTVCIYDDSAVKKYESKYNTFETQTLPLGTYYVTAENCTPEAAEEGNGKMRICGNSGNIVLSAETMIQNATVECTVANAKVSVQFDASVQGRFDNLQVLLSGGTTPSRTLTIAQTAASVVTQTWFNPSQLTYTITGRFNAGGIEKDVNISNTLTLSAKDNVELVVKVNLDNGKLFPAITIDTILEDPTPVTGEFNPYE